MTTRGTHLRQARTRAGLTGREVAALVHTDTGRIYAMESDRKPVGEDMIRRYVAAGLLSRDEGAAMLLGEAA